MIEFQIGFIAGLMFGVELAPDPDEDVSWVFVLDLGIFRLMLINWKEQ